MKKRIVLLGPPASGKGTQAELIKAHYGVQPTSTGAMLREEKRLGTKLGEEADRLTREGQLVPDDLIIGLVAKWLEVHHDAFVFDGFPRTLGQGIALDALLEGCGSALDIVFFFRTPFEVIKDRVLNRVTCESCQRIFRLGMQVESLEEACSACGGTLKRRSDDSVEALQNRMAEYHQKTEPLIDFYRQKGILVELTAADRPETVFAEISTALENVA